jgi:hypothetical protein
MDNEILGIISQTIIIILSATGGLFCIYIFGCIIFNGKNRLYIKGNTYLVVDIDEIGEKLEYYVRKIESDIDSRYIYISKIILYSKKLSKSKNENNSSDEIYKICKILAGNYNNIIFLNDFIIENEKDILSFISMSSVSEN